MWIHMLLLAMHQPDSMALRPAAATRRVPMQTGAITKRTASEWQSSLRWSGGDRGSQWSAQAAPRGPDAFAARSRLGGGSLVVGGITSLAPLDSPGWRGVFSGREERRAPAPSASSAETGLAWSGPAGPVHAVVGGGRSRSGVPTGRVELLHRGVDAGWLATPSGAVVFVGLRGKVGGAPLRAEWTEGRRVAVRRVGLGGGRTGGGFVLEARREEGVRRWGARAGSRFTSSGVASSVELETWFDARRSGSRLVASAVRSLAGASLRADARAGAGERARVRLEASDAGLEVGGDWLAGDLASVDLGWRARAFHARVQLPERGPTRVRTTVGPFGAGLGHVRVGADWRGERSTDLLIEWRGG
jgi:hypothetical protein